MKNHKLWLKWIYWQIWVLKIPADKISGHIPEDFGESIVSKARKDLRKLNKLIKKYKGK